MYVGLHVKYRLFVSDFNEIGIFIDRFSKKTFKDEISFKKILPV